MCTGKEGNSWRQGLALGSKSASALAVAQQVTRREADNPQPQFLHLQDGSIKYLQKQMLVFSGKT